MIGYAFILIAEVVTAGLIQPAAATSQDYVAFRYIQSTIKPKPAPKWDAVIAPQLARRDQQAAQAAAEQARIAQEARDQAAQQQAAQQAAPIQPAQSAPAGNCSSWMAQAGITDVTTALAVINIESGCNPNAVNASSGACGIGQQLPCGKWSHQWNDPVGSLIDMQNYVFAVYGSWGNALAHEHSHGWY